MSDREIEARILDDDDLEAYSVYGDALLARGDPRGELVAIQCRLAASPAPELRARETQLIDKHRAEWLGWLANLGAFDFKATWRGGFLRAVRIGPVAASHHASEIDFAHAIAELARIPGTQFLRELVIGATERDGYPTSWHRIVKAIAEHGVPPNLARLEILAGTDRELSTTTLGELWPAYPRLARLRELVLEIGAVELGAIRLPELRALTIRTCGLTTANLASIARASWPCLERLVLWLGETGGRGNCDLELADLAEIFAAANLPSVRHLALANSSLADDLARALAASKILRQLETLDLSAGTLSDDGGAVLLAHRAAFAHLQRLDLSHAYLSPALRDQLATICAQVVLGDPQSPDDDFRVVAVPE